MDLGQHQLERAVDERVDFLGVEALGDGREAGDVGEEHADLLALPRERRAVLQDPRREMRGSVRTRRLEPRGRHGGRRGRGGGERGAARAAEFLSRRDAGAARGTHHVERRAALLADGFDRFPCPGFDSLMFGRPALVLFQDGHRTLDSHNVVREYLGPLDGHLTEPSLLQKIPYIEMKLRLFSLMATDLRFRPARLSQIGSRRAHNLVPFVCRE